MSEISTLDAMEILDSRGNPTIQVTARLSSGTTGTAKVPSGASTGQREAVELRDGDSKRYRGKGVRDAVSNVLREIQPAVKGHDAEDQKGLDEKLISLDGTANKSRLGANAILGVSMSVARARAIEKGIPLYQHLSTRRTYLLPVPMFNVLNGGRHADNKLDFQEFMIAPVGAPTFSEAVRAASETFQCLREVLRQWGCETGVGDEGGFAPNLRSHDEAMEVISLAIEKAGYKLGQEIAICLDPAASEFFDHGKYVSHKSDGAERTTSEMILMWTNWLKQYPEIYSLEDGLAEEDWEGWKELTVQLGDKVQLVGDDIFVTNPDILEKGARNGIGNSILIKLNQIGTVTETLQCIALAGQSGYTAVISHRSGETDDTTIADLAVATDAGQIKAGSVARGERVAKYNRLLEIEHELGSDCKYAGRQAYARWR
jgi:enolase